MKYMYLKALFGCKIQCFISLYSFFQTTRTSILLIMQSQNVVSETSPQYVLQSEMGKSNTQDSHQSIWQLHSWLCNILRLPLQDFLEMQMTELYGMSAEAYLPMMEVYQNK